MTKKRHRSARRKKKSGKVRTETRDMFKNIPHLTDGKDPKVLGVGELMLPPPPSPPPPESLAVEPEPDPEHAEIDSALTTVAEAHLQTDEPSASFASNDASGKNMAKKTDEKRPDAKVETTAESPAAQKENHESMKDTKASETKPLPTPPAAATATAVRREDDAAPTEPGGIQDALAKLIRSVDLLRRQERYGQFSLTTLFGVCFQVISAILFLILVIMIVSTVPLKTIAPVGIVNVLLQLMAMTFLLMNSRR